MAEMLLINPRRRKAARKTTATKRRRTSVKRRRNPIAVVARPARRRRHVAHRAGTSVKRLLRRRRRNPIGNLRGVGGSYMAMIKEAMIGGAGAVAIDVVYGQIAKFLPTNLQRVPGTVGTGDAVKAIATVLIGTLLNKPTKGLAKKAALAALTVQAHDIIKTFVPASLPLGGLGFMSPARTVIGTNRVGPLRKGMNAYTNAGGPVLNAYQPSGSSALLSGAAQRREGVSTFY